MYMYMVCNHFPVILLYIMKKQGDAGFVSKESRFCCSAKKKGKLVGLFLFGPAVELVIEHQIQRFGIDVFISMTLYEVSSVPW